ncbi:hypothetical protein [Conchiformibius kuhniae]|uniref:Uncharacterized protein n=1 Tax=Conchiformibius kuhniae TaxID=211502 RepID=A0A8T9MVX8_9NEIS|nr:hypothetical protein [Conchiformibius kuhniae]UOP04322.1 hypothetical protein LVJ77_08130 [Conchiformibius kuhniae]
MNQPNTVSITMQRGFFILCLALFAFCGGNAAHTLFTAKQGWWGISVDILAMISSGVVMGYFYRCLRDKRVHIRLDGHGVYLREAVREQNGVRATVNDLTLAWQDIERCELNVRIFGELWELHTRNGACYQTDLLAYGIWRTRTFTRKIQALHQADPEQRARLLAEF